MGRRVGVAALVAVGVVMAACSSASDIRDGAAATSKTQPATTTEAPTTTEPRDEILVEPFTVTGALAELPLELDPPDPAFEHGRAIEVAMADLDFAAGLSGLQRPDPTDSDAVGEWFEVLTRGVTRDRRAAAVVTWGGWPHAMARRPLTMDEVDAELGWSLLDAQSFVSMERDPFSLTVLRGPFAAIDGGPLAEAPGQVVSFGRGEDYVVSAADRTAARPLGRPLRAALGDRAVALSPSTTAIETWLGSSMQTLADVPELAAIGKVLDEERVYAARIRHLPRGLGDFRSEPPPVGEHRITAPFRAVAVGWVWVGDRAEFRIVWYFEDAATAAAQLDPIDRIFRSATDITNRPFDQYVTLLDIRAEQTMVVASLSDAPSNTPSVMDTMFFNSEPPFVYVDPDAGPPVTCASLHEC